jgi:hypothetical protein
VPQLSRLLSGQQAPENDDKKSPTTERDAWQLGQNRLEKRRNAEHDQKNNWAAAITR